TLVEDGAEARECIAVLNIYFFDAKRFRCIEDLSRVHPPLNTAHFGRALMDRSGSPVMIAVLYRYLAEHLGVQLEIVDFHPLRFLRWNDNGRSRFVDIARNGAILSSDEIIEWLQSKAETVPASTFEVSPFELVVSDYIADLKVAIRASNDFEKLLFLQNALVSYQPSNIHLLAERAALSKRLGQFKNALNDLKRYFTFIDKAKAAQELLDLHDDLVRLNNKI
ncbi:MAG TPA: transglutaminase family protein, partial [Bdellovibrionales bacterium]|nr:transglutaminase family protein [Bdellovibrionales bacterium]